MTTPSRAHHQRYLQYLQRFEYFGRGGAVRLKLDAYCLLLTEAEAIDTSDPAMRGRARELRAALLED